MASTQIVQITQDMYCPPCEEVQCTVIAAPRSLCPSHAHGAVRQPLVDRDRAHPSGSTPSAERRGHSSLRPRFPLSAAGTGGRAGRGAVKGSGRGTGGGETVPSPIRNLHPRNSFGHACGAPERQDRL